MAKDPVCGMTVDENDSEKAEYQGRTFYFCSTDCKHTFEEKPEHYAKKTA